MHPDERRLTFAQAMDRAVPWLLVSGITLNVSVLVWLCLGQITLQQQVAVILERTTSQTAAARQNADDIRGLLNAQSELQRQLEELKARSKQ